jgi:hypothetical protein
MSIKFLERKLLLSLSALVGTPAYVVHSPKVFKGLFEKVIIDIERWTTVELQGIPFF